MSAAIGLFAVKAGVGIVQNGFAIKDSFRSEANTITQLEIAKGEEATNFRRRMAERALELAGEEAEIISSVGSSADGRSLGLAVMNVTQRSSRQTADDAMSTANRRATIDRQIAQTKFDEKRKRINAITNMIMGGASSGAGIAKTAQATSFNKQFTSLDSLNKPTPGDGVMNDALMTDTGISNA